MILSGSFQSVDENASVTILNYTILFNAKIGEESVSRLGIMDLFAFSTYWNWCRQFPQNVIAYPGEGFSKTIQL